MLDLIEGFVENNKFLIEQLEEVLFGFINTCPAINIAGNLMHSWDHLQRTGRIAGYIASEDKKAMRIAMIGGYLHDIGRKSDSDGAIHGIDGARIVEEFLPHYIEIDKAELYEIYYTIAEHANFKTTKILTRGAVWDADRIELKRDNIIPTLDQFSTEKGRELYRLVYTKP